jgi:L-lactate dehydrogenase complex protein LldG
MARSAIGGGKTKVMNSSARSPGRPSVLEEIRRALGRSESVRPAPLEPSIDVAGSLESEEIVALFIEEVMAVGGQVQLARSGGDVAERIAQICYEAGVSEVAMSGAGLLTGMKLAENLAERSFAIVSASDYRPDEQAELSARLASCGAGVTAIDYAIAETGTIVLSSDEEYALLVSLLPAIHIAVLGHEQISAGIDAVVGRLKAERMARDNPSRAATFITGPSRTSDVELTLSIGVHGPKQLHLIITS